MSYQYSQDPEENLPDWLKELRKRQRETGRLEPEENQQSEAVPEEAPAPESEPEAAPPPSEGAEPDWLLEIRRRHQEESLGQAPRPEPEIPSQEPPPVEDEDSEEAKLEDTQPKAPEPSEDLAEASSPVETEPEAEEEPLQDVAATPEPEELLLGADDEEDPTDEKPGTEESPAVTPAFEEDPELPDWLLQDEPEDDLGQIPAFVTSEDESDLSPADLPSWLQALRPPSGAGEVDASSSRALLPDQERVGPLAGLSGVLPAEPEIVQIGKPRMPSGRLDITESQQHHAITLGRLIAEEGRPKEDLGKQIALPSRILNLVIATTLLVATMIPLLTGSRSATLPLRGAYPLAEPLLSQIETLPDDVPVLVAFDVEPSLYGEVQAPASQVLGHLLEQQARLIFVSTQASGPALAERLLQERLATDPNIATGNYVNLGYLSGGMAALRAFAEDPRAATSALTTLPDNPWNSPILQAIQSLGDFGLVLVIGSDPEDGRAWIEQTAGVLPDGLYMVTSARAAPLMRPYVDSHPQTLRGLVAGLAGAAHYELLRGNDDTGRMYWDAYSYGLGAAVVLILLGGLYNRLLHLRPEPAKEEEGEDA